jgi:serine acetyltransferase
MLGYYLKRAQALRARLEAERKLETRFPTLQLGTGVTIVSPGRLDVGEGVVIQASAVLHCGGLEWSAGEGWIRIGGGSVISYGAVLFGAGGINIGERLDCGPGCMIFSSRSRFESHDSHHGHLLAPVTIGDDVTLFAGCIIGPGVTIGEGAAVGAGSVVLRDVPARTLHVGVPARQIREVA